MIYFKYIILKNIAVYAVLVFLTGACCSSKDTAGGLRSEPSYRKAAEKNFDNDYKTIFNNDSTYLIIMYSPKNVTKELHSPLKFLLYDLNNEKIIFRENLSNGTAEWINNHQVRISTTPEVIKGRDEKNKEMFGYIYDVNARRKLSSQDKNQ